MNSLNPYSNGIQYLIIELAFEKVDSLNVLILILMEYSI